MAVNPKKLRPYDQPPKARRGLIPSSPDTAATGFLVMALLWLAVAAGLGTAWIAMLLFPAQLSLSLSFELPIIGTLPVELNALTVESGFTNALTFGWLSNAGFAAILFITPRLLGTRVAGEGIAFLAMLAWNLAIAGGLPAVYLPSVAAPGPLAEFPLPIDGLMLLAMLMVTAVFFRTLLAAERRLPYVSIWFFGLALLSFMGVYGISALTTFLDSGLLFIRPFDLGDTPVALIYAFVARAIVTFWILGATLGTLFYVVPRASGNPLASSGMAAVSWLLWAAFAGLSAVGALVDPSVPYAITTLGQAGTVLLMAPVFLAAGSLALTMQGRWTLVFGAGTIGFAAVAVAFLISTALLEAIGALRTVQGLVRNTEWEMGVWLFGALGSATFAFFALADHAAPRLLRRHWRGGLIVDTQLWAAFSGVTIAGLALIGAGIAHGSLIADGALGDEIQATLRWFYYLAGAGLGLVALAALAALTAMFLMYTTARRAEYAVADSAPADATDAERAGPSAPAGATAGR